MPHDASRESYCLVSPVFDLGVLRLRQDRRYVVGRDPHATVRLPSKQVSRKHALLKWEPEERAFVIEDQKSLNGMTVNGESAVRHPLRDDDLVKIGGFELRFRVMQGDLDALMSDEELDDDATRPMEIDADGKVVASSRLAGRFSRTDLFEICQLIDINQKSGRLQIEGAGLSGSIYLFRGGIVQADAGGLADVEAARKLLDLPEGTFRFHDEGKPTRPMPSPIPLRTIVMDVARERDEWSGGGLRLHDPYADASPDLFETQHD